MAGLRFVKLRGACRGVFALAVEWRFAPGIEQVKTLLRLAKFSSARGLHVKANGATIDL